MPCSCYQKYNKRVPTSVRGKPINVSFLIRFVLPEVVWNSFLCQPHMAKLASKVHYSTVLVPGTDFNRLAISILNFYAHMNGTAAQSIFPNLDEKQMGKGTGKR